MHCEFCRSRKPVAWYLLRMFNGPDKYRACSKCLWFYAWVRRARLESARSYNEFVRQRRIAAIPNAVAITMLDGEESLCRFAQYMAANSRLSLLPRDMVQTVLMPMLACGKFASSAARVTTFEISDIEQTFIDSTNGLRAWVVGSITVTKWSLCRRCRDKALRCEVL